MLNTHPDRLPVGFFLLESPAIQAQSSQIQTKKSRSEERLFCTIKLESVRGSAGSSRGGFRSGRSGFRSGSSRSCFRSGGGSNFSGRCCGCSVNSRFFFLTAGCQSDSSDQRSQQERLFHACVLKRSVNKTGVHGTMCRAHSPIRDIYETRAKDASQLALLHIQPLIIRRIRLFPIVPGLWEAGPHATVAKLRQFPLTKTSASPRLGSTPLPPAKAPAAASPDAHAATG